MWTVLKKQVCARKPIKLGELYNSVVVVKKLTRGLIKLKIHKGHLNPKLELLAGRVFHIFRRPIIHSLLNQTS